MYRLYSFEPGDGSGTVLLPVFNPTDDISPAPPRMRWAETVNGPFDGYGSDTAPGGFQALAKRCTLHADTRAELQNILDQLKALNGKRGKLYARLHDGTTRWRYARARLEGEWPHSQPLWVSLQLTFETNDPLWRGTPHNQAESITVTPDTISLDNGGNAPVTSARITVSGTATPITSVTIGVSGVSEFQWAGSLGSGDTLAIDCGARSVLLNGADAFDGFTLTGNHASSDWLTLMPGSNSVDVTIVPGGALPAGVEFEYYDLWQ